MISAKGLHPGGEKRGAGKISKLPCLTTKVQLLIKSYPIRLCAKYDMPTFPVFGTETLHRDDTQSLYSQMSVSTSAYDASPPQVCIHRLYVEVAIEKILQQHLKNCPCSIWNHLKNCPPKNIKTSPSDDGCLPRLNRTVTLCVAMDASIRVKNELCANCRLFQSYEKHMPACHVW